MSQPASTPHDPAVVPSSPPAASTAAALRSSPRLASAPGGSRVLQNSRAPAQLSLFGRRSLHTV